jgi:NADPH:quinone reductase-like Zn-dependent oxidoreductase
VKPIIDKVFSFEEAPEAYKYLASGKHVGKVVVKIP